MATATTKTKAKEGEAQTVGKDDVGRLPAVQGQAQVPATSSRAERLAADAGKGVSKNADDKTVPLIKVLQVGSPQCLRQKPEFIKDAKAGDFYIKGSLTPVISGEVDKETGEGGMERVISCAFKRCWLEFDGPRDDDPQFVARHEDGPDNKPAGIGGLFHPEGEKYDWQNEAGHRFTFSREHYIIYRGRPYVLPFGGTGHQTSRDWQTMMDQYRLTSGAVEPSWNRAYKLTTIPQSNSSGDWYGVKVEPLPGEVSDEEYEMGLLFFNQVQAGEKVAEAPESEGGAKGETAGNRPGEKI